MHAKLRASKIDWISYKPLAFISLILSIFKKQKEIWNELIFLPYFLHDFWKKVFLVLYSINWPILIV